MADTPPQPVLIVAGPTGSGKSALALDVAETFGGWVINADSMQVYRELRVLTARPSAADEARAPHRLYGVLSAADACSAGRWLELAAAEIARARAAGAWPIVVGGTGLYLEALLRGLAPVPPVPTEVRAEATALYDRLGGAAFRDRLAARDPEAAARLPASDRQRLIRAMEVVRATGRPLSDWQRQPAAACPVAGARTVLLLPERDALYAALDARFERMLAAGAEAEVAALLAMRLDPGLPAMKALGVRELAAGLRGEIGRQAAVDAAKRQTRRFAKRQVTWLRHRLGADRVPFAQYSETMRVEIFAFIRESY